MYDLPKEFETKSQTVRTVKYYWEAKLSKEQIKNQEKRIKKLTYQSLKNLDKRKGVVTLITSDNFRLSRAICYFIYHKAQQIINEKDLFGKKLVALDATELLTEPIEILHEADIVILDNLPTVEKFKMRNIASKLAHFQRTGGICLIPNTMNFKQLYESFDGASASFFFKGSCLNIEV